MMNDVTDPSAPIHCAVEKKEKMRNPVISRPNVPNRWNPEKNKEWLWCGPSYIYRLQARKKVCMLAARQVPDRSYTYLLIAPVK